MASLLYTVSGLQEAEFLLLASNKQERESYIKKFKEAAPGNSDQLHGLFIFTHPGWVRQL